MKTFVALLSVSVASAMATPLTLRAQKCNVAPTASAKTNIQPYDVAEAATAEECQTICESDEACLSFVFGLAAHATTPSCLLYKVPAAQVPARSDGLHVFDKACSVKLVPTTAPTHAQPWGVAPKKVSVRSEQKCNCAPTGAIDKKIQPYQTTTKVTTAEECQTLCESGDACLSFLFGLPDNCRAPVCKLYKVAAAEIPIRSDKLFVFDKACPANLVPVTAPTHSAPRGLIASAVTKTTTKAKTADSKDIKAKSTESKVPEAKDTKAKTTETKNTEVKAAKAKDSKAKAADSKVTETKETQAKAVQSQVAENQQAKATIAYGKPAATSTKCQTQAKQTANANTNEVSAAQKSN
ncbi:hypothetical protein NW754_002624 [Fusarium falciforme]|uniref:Apple domain-containing protein n=1 Tax=Fusarium falciforme TaxID=195108 RepID=A0A9W8QWM9_9HYPO|nr:hypothetical protein NW754_002624 [Fusarium falciforme]KAJ4180298.1 hypothetical protein NW755_011788 [Fusarium falciforme]KAJ4247711.1 hypothetical protein NW757_008869 [Fusarium falciforme]